MSGELLRPGDDWKVINADTLVHLPKLPDCSVDAVVSDPPYGIDFQGEAWDGKRIRTATDDRTLSDGQAFERWTSIWAAECLRVLKPGGHIVTFGATRVVHRLASGLEDAGLDLRDTLMWMYGQGMPKSRRLPGGQGTALKPAYEPIILARRPLQGTTQANVAAWGTGTINIDPCRIAERPNQAACTARSHDSPGEGRWPANVLLGHADRCSANRCAPDCPAQRLEQQAPGTSRFFYQAKASRTERDAGCEQLPARTINLFPSTTSRPGEVRNPHPTVKPLALMRWLVRLISPEGGLVLDPFCGSGSTGCAALLEGRRFVGIELDEGHAHVARARIAHWAAQRCPEAGRPRVRPTRAGRSRRPA